MQDDPVLLQTRSSLVTSDRKGHPLFVSLHLSDTCSNTAKRQSGKASSAREASSHKEPVSIPNTLKISVEDIANHEDNFKE